MIGNKTVVYTSGTFDMLHEGDIKMIGPTDEVMPVYDEFMS